MGLKLIIHYGLAIGDDPHPWKHIPACAKGGPLPCHKADFERETSIQPLQRMMVTPRAMTSIATTDIQL
ncbi:hypothetical protein JCM19231_5002 [Vibrio ishigakensis]|uniref:Uncharacterized protein n=1 Tax=Vibrio ishigakensis TaxID=1481914 RepID=A0A0B8P680_9VIBR|nr:hypothetical protein JCM19231_5002 [Vibrio ishigakensis]